jgi:hypothetical protein
VAGLKYSDKPYSFLMKKVRPRSFLITAVAGAAILIVVLAVILSAGIWVEAIVDHKSVTGTIDGTSMTLVTVTPQRIIVNPAISDLVDPSATTFVMTEEIESELESRGYHLGYVGNLRAETRDSVNNIEPGSTLGLFCSKEIFNEMDVGEYLTYQASFLAPMHVLGIR